MNMMVDTTIRIDTFIGNDDNGRPKGKKYYQVGRYWKDPKTGVEKCLYGDFLETMSLREAKTWARDLKNEPKQECVSVD